MKKLMMIMFLSLVAIQVIDAMPAGSYQDTCRRCSVVNGTLSCRCQAADGTWRWTSTGRLNCWISNMNGHLMCNAPAPNPTPDPRPYPGPPAPYVNSLPAGSYTQTCRRCAVSNGTLSCRCQAADGSWRWSSTGRLNCWISNMNGHLMCNGPAPNPTPGQQVRRDVRNGTWTAGEVLNG